jgi:MFS family permease
MTQIENFDTSQSTFTLEEAIEKCGFGPLQWRLTFMYGMWWAADAVEILLVSFLIPAVTDEWGLSHFEGSLIGAATFLGIFVGGFIWGTLADKYGRKIAYLLTTIYTATAGFVSALAPQWILLSVLRFFLGIGIGAAGVAFAAFTEFLPTRNRGLVLVLFESFWTVGILMEIGIAWLVLPSLGWRWLLIFSATPLFILFLFYPFIFESPRYLLISGRAEEAEKVLQRVAQINGAHLPSGHLKPLPPEPRGKLRDLFSSGLRLLTSLLWVIWFNSSLIYYGIVLFTPEYFQSFDGAILSGNLFLFVLITSLAEFPGVILSALIVERLGRKKTVAIFFILCGASLYLLLIVRRQSVVALVMIMTARMFIEGCYSVLWAYSPEVC